jgi:anti-sigma regulatory factor (Ser/Thr protein kinase)
MSHVGGQEPTGPAHRQFPPQPHAAASARGFVVDWLASAGTECPEAAAVVGELASNAVRYGTSDFEVRIQVGGSTVRIEVRDRSPEAPAMQPLSPESTGGRGLHIVDAYADAWGTDFLPGGGKCVWAELFTTELESRSDGQFPTRDRSSRPEQRAPHEGGP